MIEVYVVSRSFDRTSAEVARFTDKRAADALAARGNVPGSMEEYSVRGPEPVYESLAEFDRENPEARRRRALAKLTPEERRDIGLRE